VHERAPFADRLGHGAVFDVSGMVGTLHDRALSWPSPGLADIHRRVFYVRARPQCADIIARCLTACFPSNTPTPSAAGLLDLLDGPHQRLNGTLQIFRVHLVRFVARKVDADQHDIGSIAEAVGSIASDVGSNRNLPNSQLPIGASYRKVIAGISSSAALIYLKWSTQLSGWTLATGLGCRRLSARS
jgi:hypothetical protein